VITLINGAIIKLQEHVNTSNNLILRYMRLANMDMCSSLYSWYEVLSTLSDWRS